MKKATIFFKRYITIEIPDSASEENIIKKACEQINSDDHEPDFKKEHVWGIEIFDWQTRKDDYINTECAVCGSFAGPEGPPEGENCVICQEWVCGTCVDMVVGPNGCVCRNCTKIEGLDWDLDREDWTEEDAKIIDKKSGDIIYP